MHSEIFRSRQHLPRRVAVGARRGHQTSVPVSCSVTPETATPPGYLQAGIASLGWQRLPLPSAAALLNYLTWGLGMGVCV